MELVLQFPGVGGCDDVVGVSSRRSSVVITLRLAQHPFAASTKQGTRAVKYLRNTHSEDADAAHIAASSFASMILLAA